VTGGKVPLKLWTQTDEAGALEQATNLTNLPFAFHHVAIMADAHQGYGMPIGGVLATVDAVVPNAVGVDIGCGMATATADRRWDEVDVHAIMADVARMVPTGFAHHQAPQSDWRSDTMMFLDRDHPIVDREYEASLRQIGTLGGGNHFIEAQRSQDGRLHFMVHSGSRNIGFKVAAHYNQLAVSLNYRWRSAVLKEWELAFLPLESDEGQQYLVELDACLQFAKINRFRMMVAIAEACDRHGVALPASSIFDIHHNYAAMEHHYGKNVLVHRKGAVRARAGETVIIPGSMGSHSYIAKGLGHHDSFESCSHGAGRVMGRKAAVREIPAEVVIDQMRDHGVELFKPKMDDVAEESVFAYKNLDEVMANQRDLVTIVERRQPLAVIKA
jgi:tRNA-splicing ligase RtcB